MNQKLQEVGSKLNVSKEDIRNIQKEKIKGKFLYPVIGLIIVVFSTIVGFFMGKANPVYIKDYGGYPFAAGLIAATRTSKKKKFFLATIIATILLSVIGFVAAYRAGQETFGVAILYNVYERS